MCILCDRGTPQLDSTSRRNFLKGTAAGHLRDADDDFNKVFGREFMGTYMAQVKRLRGGG